MVELQQKGTVGSKQEVTLKDFIISLEEKFRLIVKKWKILLFTGTLFLLLFGYKAATKDYEYTASLSFMINQDSGNPLGSLGGMLGNFGITAKGKNNLAKIMELSRSRTIIQNALDNSVNIDSSDKTMLNHLISYLDSTNNWNQQSWFKRKMDSLPLSIARKNIETDNLDERERKALKQIIKKIAGDPDENLPGMLQASYNEDSRIMYIRVKSKNPLLSIALTNVLFDELSNFYIKKSTEKQKSTYDIIKNKTDSLNTVLNIKEQELATLEDTWLGRYSSQSKLRERQLEKDIRILNIALAESIKNLEIADFALKNTTPFIQVVDRPVIPLDGTKPSLIKKSILGFMLGLTLSLVFFVLRDVYFRLMKG